MYCWDDSQPTFRDVYSEIFDFAHTDSVSKSFMVATLPRTGSTYLCRELWQTGVAGAPMEYLNLEHRRFDMLSRLGNGDYVQYWNRLRECRTSSNGVFSFKVFVSDFESVTTMCPELLSLISPDEIIYLTRRDKLAQAVSLARAKQTAKWFSTAGEYRPPSFDSDAIRAALGWIQAFENAWELLFDIMETAPLRLFYEDLENDLGIVLEQALDYLGIFPNPDACVKLPALDIQRDSLSAAWAEMYRNSLAGEWNGDNGRR